MSKCMKKIFVLGTFTLTTFFLGSSELSALSKEPAWQEESAIDERAFRYVMEVPAQDIEVPTVIEILVTNDYLQNKTAVVKDSVGTYQTALYKTYRENQEIPMSVFSEIRSWGEENSTDRLLDKRLETFVDFPFNEEVVSNTVSITLSGNKNIPITTSELHFTLAPHVALPKTITITSISGIDETVLISKSPLQSTVVRFPETTASRFTVEFELVQPLRLAEIEFVQKSPVLEEDAIRFLAEPNESYTIYVDPDRSYGTVVGDRAFLNNDVDVLKIEGGKLQINMRYTLSDSDSDGVPDVGDNCVTESNSDQKDVDRNGRGDVCDDFDRDGIPQNSDNCPNTPNIDQRDTDRDGVGDACDTEENRLTERNPWIPWAGMLIAALVLLSLLAMSVKMKKPEPETSEAQEG